MHSSGLRARQRQHSNRRETRWLHRPGLPYPPSSSFSSSFYLFISYSSFFSRHKLDSLFCSAFCSWLPFNSTSIQNLHVSAKHRAWGEELYYSPECIKALAAKLPSSSIILIENRSKWVHDNHIFLLKNICPLSKRFHIFFISPLLIWL